MLTYEEELALSDLLVDRREVEEQIKEGKSPTAKQQKIIQLGNAAASEIVEHYLPAIRALASSMLSKSHNPKVTFDDLVNEGVAAAMICTNAFNARKGNRFASYSSKAISKAMGRFMAKMSVPLSVNVQLILHSYEYSKAKNDLTNELGREPTIEEIEDRCNIDTDYISEAPSESSFYSINENESDYENEPEAVSQNAEAAHEYIEQESAIRYALGKCFTDEIVDSLVLYLGIDRMLPRDTDELAMELGITPRKASYEIKRIRSYLVHPAFRSYLRDSLEEYLSRKSNR